MNALELNNLTKKFGNNRAVDNLTIKLNKGEFLGLVGRNGAGKTTAINLATGLLKPTYGQALVMGLDVQKNPVQVKRQIGVMPQEESFLGSLTGRQYIQFVGRVYGLKETDIKKRRDELFQLLELDPDPGTLIRDYSYGMKKKVGLCAALVHGPQMVFLDEPFESIDPVTSRTIKDILIGLQKKGITILMSSHTLELVEKLCPLIAIIDHGQLKAFGSMEDLQRSSSNTQNLEELFVELMGGAKKGELSWL
jgi:ABC-2 type transport system ATP-binding protein